jgi:hypothetical protein
VPISPEMNILQAEVGGKESFVPFGQIDNRAIVTDAEAGLRRAARHAPDGRDQFSFREGHKVFSQRQEPL